MNIKKHVSALLMIFACSCAVQKPISFNSDYIGKLVSKYESRTLTPDDVGKIHLDEKIDHSYKMTDLENNQIYSYNYNGVKNDLLQFKVVTTASFLSETIFLNKSAQFIKSNLFSYDKSCSFVLGICERMRYAINGTEYKEKVETSFEKSEWVIKVYREINNKFVLHSTTHTIYDKKGLPIYNKVFFKEHKISAEFARTL